MNLFKRAWISILRRKTNSIVLLLIVFVLANVLFTTLIVTNSLKNTKQMVLKQFPPIVNIQYNYDDKDSDWKAPAISVESVETLYNNAKDIIKNYDYTQYLNIYKQDDMDFARIAGSDENYDLWKNNNASFSMYGTQLAQTNLVAKGEAKLISGVGFSETDIKEGTSKVIISKQLAEANDLEVGSIITLTRKLFAFENVSGSGLTQGEPFFSEDIDLEIVGIMEINSIEEFIKKQEVDPTENNNELYQMEMEVNKIYCVNNFMNPIINDNFEKIKEKYPNDKNNLPFGQSTNISPEFILNNMSDLEAFTNIAKDIFNEDDFAIVSVAKEYEIVAKPLDSMENLLNLVFRITVLASILVLTLVLCIFMYLRQKEMGILLALGEKRGKIIGQLLIETLLISLIGATLAIFTAMIFSNMISENTIANLLTTASNSMDSLQVDYGLTPEFISEQYQSGLSFTTLVIFYITMIATIIISQLATVLYLLRLNPKKILM